MCVRVCVLYTHCGQLHTGCVCAYDLHAQAIWRSIPSPCGELFERFSLLSPELLSLSVTRPSPSSHICLESHFPSLLCLSCILCLPPPSFLPPSTLHALLMQSISLARRRSLEDTQTQRLHAACVSVCVRDNVRGCEKPFHKKSLDSLLLRSVCFRMTHFRSS